MTLLVILHLAKREGTNLTGVPQLEICFVFARAFFLKHLGFNSWEIQLRNLTSQLPGSSIGLVNQGGLITC